MSSNKRNVKQLLTSEEKLVGTAEINILAKQNAKYVSAHQQSL